MELITSQEVVETAFPEPHKIDPALILSQKIEAVQEKFIRPALGVYYDKLAEEPFREFADSYVKPALAFFVKYSILPDLAVSIGMLGLMSNRSDNSQPASESRIRQLRLQTWSDAWVLLSRAIGYMCENRERFPDYDAESIARCRNMIGGIVL